MKIFWILTLILGLSIFVTPQKQINKSVLTGIIYDEGGETIAKAKVIASSERGKTFETYTDDFGKYEIKLPTLDNISGKLNGKPFMAQYTIRVESSGFRTAKIENYNFVKPTAGKMNLDIALEVGRIAD